MIDMAFMNLIDGGFLTTKKKGKRSRLQLVHMNSIETQLFMLFLQIANQQFQYENLPDGLESYIIEKGLFFYGQMVFFKKNGVPLWLPCANNGGLNLYSQPVVVTPYGMSGYSFNSVYVRDDYALPSLELRNKRNAVITKNNELSLSTYALIKPFVEKLAYIWESMGINNSLSRVKYLIKANKDLAPAIQTQIYNILGNNSPIQVINDKKNLMGDLEKMDFDVSYTPKDFWYDFDKTFNFILTLLGVDNNSESEKKERMVVSEVHSNDMLINLSLETRYHFRRESIKDINKLFGYDIVLKCPQLEQRKLKSVEEVDNELHP